MSVYSFEDRHKAVTNYLVLGNIRQVSAICGVGYQTIRNWRAQPWWKELEAEIVASRRIATGSKLATIVDKSLDVIDDRLTNGELVMNNKTGELQRRDVSLRDATTAANALMQRQAILEKLVRDEVTAEATTSIEEQLKGLAAEFAKMNARQNGKAVDIEYKELTEDAVYEERKAGLQAGSGGIHLQALRGEEENPAERSSSGDGESWQGS